MARSDTAGNHFKGFYLNQMRALILAVLFLLAAGRCFAQEDQSPAEQSSFDQWQADARLSDSDQISPDQLTPDQLDSTPVSQEVQDESNAGRDSALAAE